MYQLRIDTIRVEIPSSILQNRQEFQTYIVDGRHETTINIGMLLSN
jgi:hypothetical protein